MILDVKQDECHKVRLVLGGHVLDSENMGTYSSVMKGTAQLLMVITKAHNNTVQTGDIKNACLYVECGVKVWTGVGPEFELAGYTSIKDGWMAWEGKVLYDLPSSGCNWHIHLAGTLRTLGSKPWRYVKDAFMRINKACDGYNYVGCHTDDLLIMARDAQQILEQLMENWDQ